MISWMVFSFHLGVAALTTHLDYTEFVLVLYHLYQGLSGAPIMSVIYISCDAIFKGVIVSS